MKTLFDNTKDLEVSGPRSGLKAEVNDSSVRVSCRSLMQGEGWSVTFPLHVLDGINKNNAENMVTDLLHRIERGQEIEFVRFTGKIPFRWATVPGTNKKIVF